MTRARLDKGFESSKSLVRLMKINRTEERIEPSLYFKTPNRRI